MGFIWVVTSKSTHGVGVTTCIIHVREKGHLTILMIQIHIQQHLLRSRSSVLWTDDGCAGEWDVFVQSVTMLSAPGHESPRWGPLVHTQSTCHHSRPLVTPGIDIDTDSCFTIITKPSLSLATLQNICPLIGWQRRRTSDYTQHVPSLQIWGESM